MTVNVNLIVGGASAENAAAAGLIRQLDSDVDPESEFTLELLFKVAGPVWQPKTLGPRLRRLSSKGRSITAEIGVPEHFASESEMRAYLAMAIRVAIEAVDRALQKRGDDRSLSGIHQAVDRLLKTIRGNGGKEGDEYGGEPVGWFRRSMSPIEEMLDERLEDGGAVTLYSGRGKDMRYWEVWPEEDGIVVHEGSVGDRGVTSTMRLPSDATAADTIRAAVRRQADTGFSALAIEDQTIVLIRYPARYLTDAAQADVLSGEVENLINNELGWRGLGRCVNVDYDGALTFTVITVDSDAAVACIRDALDRVERLSMSTIAVQKDEKYVVVWPKDRIESEFC